MSWAYKALQLSQNYIWFCLWTFTRYNKKGVTRIMTQDEFKNQMSIIALKEKIFKIKGMYNPNLISNLSKEMWDLYLIRESICEQLLELSSKNGISIGKIKDFIKSKIKENKKKLKDEIDEFKIQLIEQSIKEWEEFL